MDMALNENRGYLGVETHCKEHCGQLHCGLAENSGLLGNRQSMEVNDAVKDISFVLAGHPIDQSTQMIAEMD
jgi:hypothetical protein